MTKSGRRFDFADDCDGRDMEATENGVERLMRTNPVLVLSPRVDRLVAEPRRWLDKAPVFEALLERLSAEQVELPLRFVERLRECQFSIPDTLRQSAPPSPGVLGLLVDRESGDGLVTPLQVELLDSDHRQNWSIEDHLPFGTDRMQRLFLEMARALDLPAGVPERLAFSINDGLGELAVGRSMDVAALLAVVRELSGGSPLLDAACAVVEPGGEVDELRACGEVTSKLEAFSREIGEGTLLVRHAGCGAAEPFDDSFDQVWAIRSLKELAEKLQDAGLLEELFEQARLGADELRRINRRLEQMIEEQHHYSDALDLARRVRQCDTEDDVPAAVVTETQRAFLDSRRHRGSLKVLEEERQKLNELEDAGRFTCYEDLADKAVHFAASCYDPHLFGEMIDVLSPWVERVEEGPRLLSPKLRYMLFNTLARARIARQEQGWKRLLERSLTLQKKLDSGQVQRTRNYLIHGLLRFGKLEAASEQIQRAVEDATLSAYSEQFLCFYRADLARRQGELWEDEQMEQVDLKTAGPGHPGGYYYQATARQSGRNVGDRRRRFEKARQLFLKDFDSSAEKPEANSVLYLLASAVGLAKAGYGNGRDRWARERGFLEDFLETRMCAGMGRYYRDVMTSLDATPDVRSVEELLRAIPHF